MHGLPLLLGERSAQEVIQRQERGLGAAFAGCPIRDVSVEVEGCQDVQRSLGKDMRVMALPDINVTARQGLVCKNTLLDMRDTPSGLPGGMVSTRLDHGNGGI